MKFDLISKKLQEDQINYETNTIYFSGEMDYSFHIFMHQRIELLIFYNKEKSNNLKEINIII